MVEKAVQETIKCDGHYRNIDVPCGWKLAIKIRHPDDRIEFKILPGRGLHRIQLCIRLRKNAQARGIRKAGDNRA